LFSVIYYILEGDDKMPETRLFNGIIDFKEIVESDEYRKLQRENKMFDRTISGTKAILKGDIVEVSQNGFTDDLTLVIIFDNKKDVFGNKLVKVTSPKFTMSEYFSPKSNMNVELSVEFTNTTAYGYPVLKVDKWLKLENTLMFPYYICPYCGKNYGNGSEIADFPERQYCDICAGIEEDYALIPIHNREEYRDKIKHVYMGD
jgi:hypothetical protein